MGICVVVVWPGGGYRLGRPLPLLTETHTFSKRYIMYAQIPIRETNSKNTLWIANQMFLQTDVQADMSLC